MSHIIDEVICASSFRFAAVARFGALFACVVVAICGIAPMRSDAADDVLARVRSAGTVRCAGIVRAGIAVPSIDGKHWSGIAVDVCRAVAAAVLGQADHFTFRPLMGSDGLRYPDDRSDDIVFLSGAQVIGDSAAGPATLVLGPVVAHDALALLVPKSGVTSAADLGRKKVCVEPGSPADRALSRYFAQHAIALHEHPFQEPDEMRQAYAGGNCDALAGPLSTLASVRADPTDGQRTDRILPEILADDPIFAATGGDVRWSRVVWWTFSALVDAEDAGIPTPVANTDLAVPGVPPAVGSELGLSPRWVAEALAAGGNYGDIYERNLGAGSRFGLPRGANALWRNGGLISALRVE